MAGPAEDTTSPLSTYQTNPTTGLLSPSASKNMEHNVPDPSQPDSSITARRSADTWTQDLLEYVAGGGSKWGEIFNLFYVPAAESLPCLLRDGGVTYSLSPDVAALAPDEIEHKIVIDDGCPFFRLDYYDDEKKEKKSVGSDTQAHHFFALGWLSEADDDNKEGAGQYSNHVLCLNVTEKPMSLWLVFDYPESNIDDDKPYQVNSAGQTYDGGMCPTITALRQHPSTSTSVFPEGLLETARRFEAPFDVVKLSDDVSRDWTNATDGMDASKVHECMEKTKKKYGGTLRAVTSWPNRDTR